VSFRLCPADSRSPGCVRSHGQAMNRDPIRSMDLKREYNFARSAKGMNSSRIRCPVRPRGVVDWARLRINSLLPARFHGHAYLQLWPQPPSACFRCAGIASKYRRRQYSIKVMKPRRQHVIRNSAGLSRFAFMNGGGIHASTAIRIRPDGRKSSGRWPNSRRLVPLPPH
jgi:hypothetical protein